MSGLADQENSQRRLRALASVAVIALTCLLAIVAMPVAGSDAGGQPANDSARINSIRVRNAPGYTRLVFDADAPLTFRLLRAGAARSIALELANLDRSALFDLNRINLAGSRIATARYSRRKRGAPRLLLTATEPLRPEVFALDPEPPYGHRLILDLHSVAVTATSPPGVPETERDVVIAIDAGHGGEDPGAVGPSGILEADVVLGIARNVAQRLNAKEGLRAVLTRDGDYYVRHSTRMQAAREARADIFISIHADAFIDPAVAGASVFALSSGGASSELAAWLAARDSRADLIGGASDVRLADKDQTLAKVLLDLSLAAQMDRSLHLADTLLAAMGGGGAINLHKRSVEQADFVVLKSPDIPSVLVETGFLSNPAEARRLSRPAYQDTLAVAIAQGIQDYVQRHPPPGAQVEASESGRRHHVVAAGESLSTVAEHYGVNVTLLQQTNRIATGDRVKIGQVLVIPEEGAAQ